MSSVLEIDFLAPDLADMKAKVVDAWLFIKAIAFCVNYYGQLLGDARRIAETAQPECRISVRHCKK